MAHVALRIFTRVSACFFGRDTGGAVIELSYVRHVAVRPRSGPDAPLTLRGAAFLNLETRAIAKFTAIAGMTGARPPPLSAVQDATSVPEPARGVALSPGTGVPLQQSPASLRPLAKFLRSGDNASNRRPRRMPLMPNLDRLIDEKPGHLIRRLQQIAVSLFMAETKGFDITPVQYAALLAIRLHPGIDQTALVNIIAFDRSTTGDVVGRLVAKRLIKRTKGAHDGRTKVLHLTPAGEHLLLEIEPRVRSAQRLILAPLDPAERADFVRMLRKLVNINNEHSRVPRRAKEERGRRVDAKTLLADPSA